MNGIKEINIVFKNVNKLNKYIDSMNDKNEGIWNICVCVVHFIRCKQCPKMYIGHRR